MGVERERACMDECAHLGMEKHYRRVPVSSVLLQTSREGRALTVLLV